MVKINDEHKDRCQFECKKPTKKVLYVKKMMFGILAHGFVKMINV